MLKISVKKYIYYFTKLVVSISLLLYLIISNNLIDVLPQLYSIKVIPFLIGVFIVGIMIVLMTIRWILIIRLMGNELQFSQALKINFIGLFFNQVLPTTVGGDVVRVWALYKYHFPLSASIRSVLVDRILGLIGLVLHVTLMLPAFYIIVQDLVAFWSLAYAIISIFIVTLILFKLSTFNIWILSDDVSRGIRNLSEDLKGIFSLIRTSGPVLLLSIITHSASAIAVFLIGYSLDFDFTLLDCLILVPLVFLIALIPISIAGWGIREGAAIIAFGMVGIPSNDALILSILFGIVLIVTSLPGGIYWILFKKETH